MGRPPIGKAVMSDVASSIKARRHEFYQECLPNEVTDEDQQKLISALLNNLPRAPDEIDRAIAQQAGKAT
jgi:hypothetical protein